MSQIQDRIEILTFPKRLGEAGDIESEQFSRSPSS